MPKYEWLDSSARKENPTIIIGKNILLKIIEDEQKQALLNDPDVKKFVGIYNLPNTELGSIVDEIVDQDEYLDTPLLFRNVISNGKFSAHALKKVMKNREQYSHFLTYLLKTAPTYEEFLLRSKGKVDEEFVASCEKKLLALNNKFEEKTGVKIVVPSNLFVCPKCNARLLDEEIAEKRCLICNSTINQRKIKRIPVYRMHDRIKNVWRSGLWFEAYLAGLLSRFHYKTWISVHVMGASGILHEIDVVAIRNGTLIVCECKTGKISRNDVFNFCTKIGDIKAHVAILALVGSLPEPQTRDFVKKNPAIIRLENMGNIDESRILDDLTQRLRIKG